MAFIRYVKNVAIKKELKINVQSKNEKLKQKEVNKKNGGSYLFKMREDNGRKKLLHPQRWKQNKFM